MRFRLLSYAMRRMCCVSKFTETKGNRWNWESDVLPSHELHCYVDRQLFEKSYRRIHRKMDEPYLLLGRKHRVLFHDPVTACAIAQHCYPGDPNAELAALFHINLDEICSANPLLKHNLELLAKIDSRERTRARRRKKATKVKKRRCRRYNPERTQFADSVTELMKFIEKIKQIQDLNCEFMK